MPTADLTALLTRLLSQGRETEWIEFKKSKADPEDIGEYISALANSAALHDVDRAYLVWDIDDGTLDVSGTSFSPRSKKVGNEELENWLFRLLDPRVDFRIFEFSHDGQDVVLFEIHACNHTPVSFKGIKYIRVGSYKKKLKDHPEKERELWGILSKAVFENGLAVVGISSDEVLSLLDYVSYFEMMKLPLPENKQGILEQLSREKLVVSDRSGIFDITNLGGILFAKRLQEFENLSRKAVRVVLYKGKNRISAVREKVGSKGYANGFDGLVAYINDQLPRNEEIGRAFRTETPMYPEIAIRELVANALIHQDFFSKGDGPMVEIFEDRVEITNPGIPLVDTLRFIDEPPQSRNEKMASFMRRLNICEERGSGIDKVISYVEVFQLPAPEFNRKDRHTQAILFSYKTLNKMEKADKVRACYQHACLQYVSNERMTNQSLRKRFGIEEKNYATASRIISETIAANLIKPHDPDNASKRHAKYIPIWV